MGGLAFLALIRFGAQPLARHWLESDSGQRTASRGLSSAIKVDGTFAPLHLEGWTIATDSYGGPGWPGEALGGIHAENIRAEFNPSAFFRHAWRIDGIQMDRASIQLQPPNDKLKRPVPAKKPRPWYAFLLPDHFECGPIVAQDTELDFSFQKESAHIHHAHVQADLIGKDLKYTATSGLLDFPNLPPMKIQRLVMLVTRPLITIDTAQLVALDPADPARISLSGQLGMRENKSISAKLEVVDVPIEQIIPEDLQRLIHGRASGHLVWTRDATGRQISSDGDLTLTGAKIDDLSVFRQLALLHDNPNLQDFSLDQAACHFHLQDGVCTLTLKANAPGKFGVGGTISYVLATKVANLAVTFQNLPLQTWLPPEFKPGSSGTARADLQWQGRLDTIKDSSGKVFLNLDGSQLHLPESLREALSPKKIRTPDDIRFQQVELAIDYQDQAFRLSQGKLVLPGVLDAQLSGSLTADKLLNATVDWQGLTIQDWLPPELADQFSGDINGHATMQVQSWKLGDGAYAGDIRLLHGALRYTSVQTILARFTNDRRLLEIPLTRASFSWVWRDNGLTVTNIDLRGRDDLGVTGSFRMSPDRRLSGTLWIGTRPVFLSSLSGVGEAVFRQHRDGLVWARVRVSGTTKKPEQDLTSQVVSELKRRPFVVLGLGFKLTSWYLGNLFGAGKDWEPPTSAQN